MKKLDSRVQTQGMNSMNDAKSLTPGNDDFDFKPFLNKSDQEFRGVISNGKNNYFIINELVSSAYTKTFSATQVNLTADNKLENAHGEALCIRYVSKKYIQDCIFKDLEINEERVQRLYESLRHSFKKFKSIEHENLQKLQDFIEDKDGLYFVLEFCEYSLFDFVTMTREPLKNSKYPIEMKLRKIILNILECILFIHKEGLYLCALINPQEISIKETGHYQNKSGYQVKLPHPFLAHLFSLLALRSSGEVFPSYFAPEIYNGINKNQNNTFEGLLAVLSKLDQSFDIWAVGYLIYNLLYGNAPFVFESLKEAYTKLKPEFTYEVYPWKISYQMLKLINDCMKFHPKKRIQVNALQKVISDINKKNEDNELLERELKDRIEKSSKAKDIAKFNLINENQAEPYNK